jgi:hypothetical protein
LDGLRALQIRIEWTEPGEAVRTKHMEILERTAARELHSRLRGTPGIHVHVYVPADDYEGLMEIRRGLQGAYR